MIKKIHGRMKAPLIGLLIVVFVFVLSACASSSPAAPQEGVTQEVTPGSEESPTAEATDASAVPQSSADPQKLMIPRWFLASLILDGQPVEVLPDQQSATLQFEPGGKVNGTGGCNNFSATFQADYDGSMKLGPVLSTKMACEGSMTLENAYFNALSKVERFSTEGGLVLSSADGKTEMVFRMPPK